MGRSRCSGTSPRVRGKPLVHVLTPACLRYIPARAGEAAMPRGTPRPRRVHPRACGGSDESVRVRVKSQGTSPRVRGKRESSKTRPPPPGYIPARAGEAAGPAISTERRWVHPRACGGSRRIGASWAVAWGTSPRVRGKLGEGLAAVGAEGYIPARAGEAAVSALRGPSPGVHPRACGGSARVDRIGPDAWGTSPRVRGKRRRRRRRRGWTRYIPARAGEASAAWSMWRLWGVHPRACGGSPVFRANKSYISGTSPRVRGKPGAARPPPKGAGYIPARAGEALRRSRRTGRKRVHPRACGGSRRASLTGYPRPGTSPRVRGKRAAARCSFRASRYIPARAGEAGVGDGHYAGCEVHPRACGGSRRTRRSRQARSGTSPRVRGKRDRWWCWTLVIRYIPARAGEAHASAGSRPIPWVHPRACGGSLTESQQRDHAAGTSPRVRGKPTYPS